MATLVSEQECIDFIPNFQTQDKPFLTDCVNAVSELIVKYCNDNFTLQTYNERYSGNGTSNLLLNHYPIVRIQRLSWLRMPIMSIYQSDKTFSRALVDWSSTLLTLQMMQSGVASTKTFTLASYPTIQDLVNGVNAYGNGWIAKSMGQFSIWATSDVYYPQGSYDAVHSNTPYIWDYVYDSFLQDIRAETGEVISSIGFTKGILNYKVIYDAGYADANGKPTVPNPIKLACQELVSDAMNSRYVNRNVANEATPVGYSYGLAQNVVGRVWANRSETVRNILSLYKNRRIARWNIG